MYKILFVCTGNICRSPTAEGLLRHYLEKHGLTHSVSVDSAGTHGYHVGEPPDMRSVTTAQKHGVAIDGLRARKITTDDFYEFDVMLGLDSEHIHHLQRIAPHDATSRIMLFLEFAGSLGTNEVPDPYYGTSDDFEYVFSLIKSHMDACIKNIVTNLAAA